MPKHEVYISIDIETDGPCPALNSMLSLGTIAYHGKDGRVLDVFYKKLYPLPGAMSHPDTVRWWHAPERNDALLEVNKDQHYPQEVIDQFGDWCTDLAEHGRLVPVAWPAAFDFGFLNWYMHQYYGSNPLGFACLDIRSYANGLFGVPGYYEKITEGDLYKMFDVETADLRDHVALDDATRQGRLFMAIRKAIILRREQGHRFFA